MVELLKSFENLLWGLPLIIGIIGTGIYISLKTKAIQFRKLPFALNNTLGKIFEKPNKENKGDISPFGALATALAATVGTGNIVGVSLAIILGGPGAIFWMWLAALLGMATKFSEVTLALAYREKKNGQYVGGPMYYIEKGLNNKKLAKTFAIFAGIAVFGIGDSTQSNAIAGVLHDSFGINTIISGFILSILAGIVIVGGINSITKVTEKLVPFMSFLYIIGCLWILFLNKSNILPAFKSIFLGAFRPKSLGGYFAGLSLKAIISAGVARGVFTNEAGLGSSPMAHACASTDHPVRQGLWGISEVFVDTIIICTMTALVILSTNVDITDTNNAASLVARAFATGSSLSNLIVSIGLSLFAFSTILGWAYYGETALKYLFGGKIIIPYRIIYVLFVFLGANMDLGLVWIIANILNGLMALPNLYALINLSPIVVKLSNDFFKNPERIRKNPDEYNYLLKND
ncbi:alanine/glycine:cation symporter family protein [Anaerococcus hydrogenalis]|uniref:alanine/glycine:cation symporter family protein n=1 Tax=Anaerococcus hydrogenalis TaxID=33029 RepID=UPI0023F1A9DA|nr:alanine/glycine:cation symporter family protein [Anaerococcus hydrogenalis]